MEKVWIQGDHLSFLIGANLSLRRILSTCVAYGVATLVWSSLVLNSFDMMGDVDKTYDEDGSKDDAMFIPLGWPRLRPGKYYAGGDPEWEMFREISNNPKYLAGLRGKNVPSRSKPRNSVTYD
jgi:hypothetical protein